MLNTGEGQVSFMTNKIIGNLNQILIDAPDKIEVLIESKLGYIILKRQNIFGVKNYSIRNRVTTPEENLLDYLTFDKFMLNEELIITIIGQKNKDVVVVLRVD